MFKIYFGQALNLISRERYTHRIILHYGKELNIKICSINILCVSNFTEPPPRVVVGSQELKSNIRKGKHYAVEILLIAIWHENFNRRNYVYNRTNLTIVRRNKY